jgi:hypothetical protein
MWQEIGLTAASDLPQSSARTECAHRRMQPSLLHSALVSVETCCGSASCDKRDG